MVRQGQEEVQARVAADTLDSGRIPTWQKLAIAGGTAVLLAGCGGPSASETTATTSLTCDAARDGRQLPSKLGVSSFEDDRVGDITPCHYLSDLQVPVGVPTELLKTTQREVERFGFTASGDFSGGFLLATGDIGGDLKASGGTKTERTTLLTFMGTDGKTEQTIVTDSDKVNVIRGGESPTVTFYANDVVLWEKDEVEGKFLWWGGYPNTQSIWCRNSSSFGGSSVAERLTDESGGPLPASGVIDQLVSKIVVNLPEGQS